MNAQRLFEELKKERGWLVRTNGSKIEVIKTWGQRAITIILSPSGGGKYHIQFPSYLFQSTISHFAPAENEYRLCRNKTLLFSMVKMLKRSAVWAYIDNPDFMVINESNDRSDKGKLKKELHILQSYKQRYL